MTPAMFWALLRPIAPWLIAAAVTLCGGLWLLHDLTADRRAEAAAERARRFCDLTWRAREADAESRMREAEHELRRRMDAVRPDPDAVPEQLRDGSF